MTEVVTFVRSRDGSPMAKVVGKAAFPDRRWSPPPKVGEEWEVEVTGTNPKGNVLFLRGVRLLSTEESRQREEEEMRRREQEELQRMREERERERIAVFNRLDSSIVVQALLEGYLPQWETLEDVEGWDAEDARYAAKVRLSVGTVSAEFTGRAYSGGWDWLLGDGKIKPDPMWSAVWPEFGEDIRATLELPAEEGFTLQEREFVGKVSRGRYVTALGKSVMTHWETFSGVPIGTDREALDRLQRQCREAEQAQKLHIEFKRVRELSQSTRNRVLLLLDGEERCGVKYYRSRGIAGTELRDFSDGGEDGMKPPSSGRPRGLPRFTECYDLLLDGRSIWDDLEGLLEAKERLERYLAELQEKFLGLMGGWPELPKNRLQVTLRRRGRYVLMVSRADAPDPISASFRDGMFLYRAERDGYSLSIWEEISELEEAIQELSREGQDEDSSDQ